MPTWKHLATYISVHLAGLHEFVITKMNIFMAMGISTCHCSSCPPLPSQDNGIKFNKPLASGKDMFSDSVPAVHQQLINRAANMGWELFGEKLLGVRTLLLGTLFPKPMNFDQRVKVPETPPPPASPPTLRNLLVLKILQLANCSTRILQASCLGS